MGNSESNLSNIVDDFPSNYFVPIFSDCFINKLLFSMKRILTSSGKQIDKTKQLVGRKVQQKEKKFDLGCKEVGHKNFQLSLAAILKENRISHTKLKNHRKSKRRLLDQNLKGKDTSRKMFGQSPKSIKALSSERFHRYCLTTLQTECLSIKNDVNYTTDTKNIYLGRSERRNLNEISELKDQILYNLQKINITKQVQMRRQMTIASVDTEHIIKQQVIDIDGQIKKIENVIKQKIDPITDILNGVTLLASKNKVNFSHILFLVYKLFYIRRVSNTEKIYKLYRQKGTYIQKQRYQKENSNIRQCMIEMLSKLKQSKKWKDVQQKWIYQKEDYEQCQLRLVNKSIMDRFICDYSKLVEKTEGNNQNSQILIQFFIGVCDLYELQQDENIAFDSKQQYKRLKNTGNKVLVSQIVSFLRGIQQTI